MNTTHLIRNALVASNFLLFLSACGGSEELISCGDQRADVCAQVYEPVCAVRGEQTRTYPSACHACLDDKVDSYSEGQCQ